MATVGINQIKVSFGIRIVRQKLRRQHFEATDADENVRTEMDQLNQLGVC